MKLPSISMAAPRNRGLVCLYSSLLFFLLTSQFVSCYRLLLLLSLHVPICFYFSLFFHPSTVTVTSKLLINGPRKPLGQFRFNRHSAQSSQNQTLCFNISLLDNSNILIFTFCHYLFYYWMLIFFFYLVQLALKILTTHKFKCWSNNKKWLVDLIQLES